MTDTATVVDAGPADVTAAADTIAAAFSRLHVARRLVPDPERRHAVFASNMEIWVDHTIRHGIVHITDDHRAVACWLPSGAPDPQDYQARLERACGIHAGNFQALDDTFAAHQPTRRPYLHLTHLAVRPDAQGRGLGSALLRHFLATHSDAPVYLEASSARARDLYRRHGFEVTGDPFTMPGDTALFWPMLRTPRPPS